MKTILAALIIMMSMNAVAQNKNYTVSNDPDGGSLIYNGLITFNDLEKEPTFTWLKPAVEAYKPDQNTMRTLGQPLKNYTMVVFMGTWCDDSHYLIPKLEKVLMMAGYPLTSVTMYGTDHAKKTKNGEDKKYGITLVPTIILFNNGKEAGRITESVQKSIEADLADIIVKNQHGQVH